MKKIFIILLTFAICLNISAQLPVASKVKNLGSTIPGKIVPFNLSYTDTLKSADTLFYKVLVNHDVNVYPYISQLTRLVANDTTATLTLWQSVDGVHNWQQLTTGTSPSAYSATIAKSTTTGTEIDFWRSIGWFNSQWFGIRFIAKTKSGFKTIYYGSVRFNAN